MISFNYCIHIHMRVNILIFSNYTMIKKFYDSDTLLYEIKFVHSLYNNNVKSIYKCKEI